MGSIYNLPDPPKNLYTNSVNDLPPPSKKFSTKALMIFLLVLALSVTIPLGTQKLISTRTDIRSKAEEKKVQDSNIALSLKDNGLYNDTYIDHWAGVGLTSTYPYINNNTFTVEAWINIPSNTSPYQYQYDLITINTGHTNPYSFNLGFNGESPYASVQTRQSSVPWYPEYLTIGIGLSPPFFKLDWWNHVAVNFYNNIIDSKCWLEMFINGVLAQRISKSGYEYCYAYTDNAKQLYLGFPKNGFSRYFAGYVDEIRISKERRYFENFIPPIPPLTADDKTSLLYHFNNDFLDSSGNNYHGVIHGSHYSFYPVEPVPTLTIIPTIITPTNTPFPIPSPILQNGSFEIDNDSNNLPDLWTTKKLDINDRLDTAVYYDGAKSFRFSPSDGTRKEQLYQTLNFTGNSDEEVRLDFYNQSDGNVTMGKLSVILTVTYQDARQETSSAILPYSAHSWKKKSLIIVTDEPYSQIKVQYINSNINTNYRIDAASLTTSSGAHGRRVKETGNELSPAEIKAIGL